MFGIFKKGQQSPTDGQHQFLQWFKTAVKFEKDWRKGNEKNFDFYDGNQWSEANLSILAERGQQATVLNIVRPTIDTMIALENGTAHRLTGCWTGRV